jgi:hypothetical protein
MTKFHGIVTIVVGVTCLTLTIANIVPNATSFAAGWLVGNGISETIVGE